MTGNIISVAEANKEMICTGVIMGNYVYRDLLSPVKLFFLQNKWQKQRGY